MNINIETEVYQLTIDSFGSELGQWLWDNNKIVPVTAEKKLACKKLDSWNSRQFKWLSTMPVALGVLPNPQLRILDIDRKSLVFGEPNVTTTKGAHYWFSGGTFSNSKHEKELGFDLLINNYAIFYGNGKTVHHSNVPNWSDLLATTDFPTSIHTYFVPITTTNALNMGIEYVDCIDGLNMEPNAGMDWEALKTTMQQRDESYAQQLQAVKFGQYVCELDKPRIQKTLCTKMRNTLEGSRNVNLFRYAIEFFRCELDAYALHDAAVAGGQLSSEVRATIDQALEAYTAEQRVSVLDRVQVWHEYASYVCRTDNQQQAVDYTAACAVAQNDLRPAVSQQELAKLTGIERRGLSKTFTSALPNYGVLIVHRQPGKQANGNRHIHNYELSLNGVALSKMTDSIDQLVKQNKEKKN